MRRRTSQLRSKLSVALLSISVCATTQVVYALPAGSTTRTNGKIAFAREPDTEGALFTIDPDGSDAVQVGNGENLRWSPDGSRLSFACFAAGDHVGVCTVNPDGSGLVHVVPQTGGISDPPVDVYPTAWSPDGRLLLIDGGAGLSNQGTGIYTMRPDGTHVTRVTSSATEQIPYAFSPDGSKIVFLQSRRDGSNDLFVVRADGTHLTRLNPANLTLDCCLPPRAVWAPDGGSIVFTALSSSSGGGSGQALFTVRPDASGLRRITPAGTDALDPKWSPDGRWIVFTSVGGFGWPEVALVHPDGSGQHLLTSPSDALAFDPVWSPDGSRIVMGYAQFDQKRHWRYDMWTIKIDGTGLARLTDSPEFDEPQDWGVSPPTP